MASLLKPRTSTAVALLGRNDGARAQLRQSLEELGASVVFEGDTAGTAANDVLEHGPSVVIVNLADNADDELDHLQSVFDAPDVNVVFNESGVSSQLKGWDLARWARHLAAKVLGAGDTMPPPPPGAEALPVHDLMPTPGAPPTPAQLAGERPIEEFVMEAEDRVDALPDDFLPLPERAAADESHHDFIDAEASGIVGLDDPALQDALTQVPATPVPPSIVRVEREPEPELEEHDIAAMLLPDLGELDRAIEADAQIAAAPARSERELLDEALGGLDLDFISSSAHDVHDADASTSVVQHAPDPFAELLASHAAAPVDTAPAIPTASVTVPFGAFYLEDEGTAADELAADADADLRADDAGSAADDDVDSASQSLSPEWRFEDDATFGDDATDTPAASHVSPDAVAGSARLDLADFGIDAPGADPQSQAPFVADSGMAVEELDMADIAADFGFNVSNRAPPAATNVAYVEENDFSDVGDEFDTTDAGLSVELSDDDGIIASDATATSPASYAASSWSSDTADLQYDDSLTLDDDVAALAAQLDAMEQDAPDRFSQPTQPSFADSALSMTPMDEDGEDGEDAETPRPATAPPVPAQTTDTPAADIDFGGLSLTSMDEEIEAAPRVALAANFDFSGVDNLTLEPLDDGEEGEGDASAPDPLLVAMGLVDSPRKNADADGIPRVIVLGASIGGPDALRTFLGGIPADFPALFLLVQHLENGYFERLAQQLQKATKLKVRALVPDGPFAAAGEVLVVPANLRFSVERNGHIEANPHESAPRYTPCIDDVLRDAADRFGAYTTAIIFSGMAGDAIEGAVYVTGKGGEVWVQDPASCVVSSMVDGARARGVVEYIGSPRELAERCVAQYGH